MFLQHVWGGVHYAFPFDRIEHALHFHVLQSPECQTFGACSDQRALRVRVARVDGIGRRAIDKAAHSLWSRLLSSQI